MSGNVLLLHAVDPQLEQVVRGMKAAAVAVDDVSYVDPVTYARQTALDLQIVSRAVQYALDNSVVRRLRPKEIEILVASGIQEREAAAYVIFDMRARLIPMDTSRSPVWEVLRRDA